MISHVNNSNVYQNIANDNSKTKADATSKEEKASQKTHVEEIRQAVQDGTYKVDLQKTAEKMAEELL